MRPLTDRRSSGRRSHAPLRGLVQDLPDAARAFSKETLVQACIDTVAENDLPHCYLRPIAIRTGEQMGVFPNEPARSLYHSVDLGHLSRQRIARRGCRRLCVELAAGCAEHFPDDGEGRRELSEFAAVDDGSQLDDYAEGIMLDSFGFVSEGSGENLFLVRDGKLFTSPLRSGILHGITRDSVARIARRLGIEVVEETMPREMLYIADELFFTEPRSRSLRSGPLTEFRSATEAGSDHARDSKGVHGNRRRPASRPAWVADRGAEWG